MKNNTTFFSSLPSINIARSRWHMNFDHPTSWQHGKIIPLDIIPVMPGDGIGLKLGSLIRMSNPIRPIMDQIDAHLYSFFVPMRLVWDNTKKFFGENDESAGPQTGVYKIPAVVQYGIDANSTATVGSISHYLHKPLAYKSGGSTTYNTSNYSAPASVLKERCYYLIYNYFYRSQQWQTPYLVYTDDSDKIALDRVTNQRLYFKDPVLTANKRFDYFTSLTLSPQYGPSVEIGISGIAPLSLLDESDAYIPDNPNAENDITQVYFGPKKGTDSQDDAAPLSISDSNAGLWTGAYTAKTGLTASLFGGPTSEFGPDGDYSSYNPFATNIVADLSNATATSVNQLRYAFAVQRFFERSNFGSLYNNYITAHFSVNPPLGLLQMPEIIGEHHFGINVQQVLSTAGASSDSSSTLGQPGANSVTGDSTYLFKKGIVEHGFICTFLHTTHDRHYNQGLMREDMKREVLELFHPEFATLGDMPVTRAEWICQATTSTYSGKSVIGYQEHWAEYRYRPSRASGLLDPCSLNSLAFWTLTDFVDPTSTFGGDFLKEDREALSRALVTGEGGPDYVGVFHFDYDVTRPMPLRTMPGLIDHVGGI